MTLNVREICSQGAWYGTIGHQSSTEPYNWEGFSFPTLESASIISIDMSGAVFNRLSEETLFTDASITLNVNNNTLYFSIVESKVDEADTIDNFLEVPNHIYFGIDEVEVKFRFMNEVLRIMKNTWGGTNNISKSSAIKEFLVHKELREYFEKNYPEMLI